jgi:hypothetical protein
MTLGLALSTKLAGLNQVSKAGSLAHKFRGGNYTLSPCRFLPSSCQWDALGGQPEAEAPYCTVPRIGSSAALRLEGGLQA